MGKKDKAHRAKVARRNLKQEQEARDDWEKIEGVLRKNGFKSVEEAIEKAPELAPILLPYSCVRQVLQNCVAGIRVKTRKWEASENGPLRCSSEDAPISAFLFHTANFNSRFFFASSNNFISR